MRITLLVAILLLAFTAASCSSAPPGGTTASPAASPAGLDPAEQQAALLRAWRDELEVIAPGHPPLSSLKWQAVRADVSVGADSVFLTGDSSLVVLSIPPEAFRPEFLAAIREGQVVGYSVAADGVQVQIPERKLYPLRAPRSEFFAPDKLQARVVQVDGFAIVSTDVAAIRKSYTRLVPLTLRREGENVLPEPGPTVKVRKGLGFRGKDLASLPASTVPSLVAGRRTGVYVDEIFPDSPADRARLLKGDVIRMLGGQPVRTSVDLRSILERAPAGKPLPLVVYRHDPSRSDVRLSITPGQFEGDTNYVAPQPSPATTGP